LTQTCSYATAGDKLAGYSFSEGLYTGPHVFKFVSCPSRSYKKVTESSAKSEIAHFTCPKTLSSIYVVAGSLLKRPTQAANYFYRRTSWPSQIQFEILWSSYDYLRASSDFLPHRLSTHQL